MMIYENRPAKMIFFCVSRNFLMNFISKMGIRIKLRIIAKNLEAAKEIGFLTKTILTSLDMGGKTSTPIFKIALKIISHRFRVIKV